MSLSRAAIVDQLKEIVGADRVITDETVLKKNSIDRFRKFPDIHGIYTLPIPAAVVKLGSTEQISRVLNFMNAHKINGVPRTGASATEGGLETVVENSVVLDGSAMNQIINIDIENMQATAQCGVPLEVLENALREKGYTTGHSPQSKPLAQMGGLVATRSIGQFSTLYGAIEDMVVGLEAVLADGTVTRIKNVPRRAAGPDIRHIIIGNEGALCYITEVTVKIFKFTPENNLFYGYILEDMKTGFNILREIMVEGYRPSIARLYDAEDGTQHFTHFADGKCVLIFMAEGNPRIAKATGEGIAEIVARYLMALGFEEAVLLETAADLRFASEFVARHIAEWQRQNPLDLIITGCQSSEGQNGQTPFLLAEMLGWPCFTQVERFTLDALFITLEQRTEHGLRCCRVRLPAVIAVRQCGEVALPVPGMRQRMAAGKAEIIRKTVAAELPAMQCLQLARAEQRRGATLIDGQTVAEKAQKLWQDCLRQRMQP
ncbi:FAD-binding protein [Escherichia coli]|nr:FAD-binding protein [Escherichia coli]EEV9197747.1 FAD-binding protein [Escherichia coli]EFB9864658.1 FAD-binding protein [Escherichia coli]EFC4837750.1 FAD-binding protein [Escherichia coli]EFH4800993.1 FAD-binding protein [Escherichia coli]